MTPGLILLSLLFSPARAAEKGEPPVWWRPQASAYITADMDQRLMQGIDDIYRMRWDAAETDARAAMALNPEHPNPYLGLAGILWTRYVYGTDQGDDSLIGEFGRKTDETIDVAQRWVKAHPDDAQGLMTLGAAYGLSSRLDIIRHQWVKGYFEGRKAVQITRQAVKADPQCWDCYLGVGMYDYYTDVYPRFIGVLAKLVLRGDRLRGIKTLEMVAAKGHYSKINAMILLVEIYTEDQWGARDPARALSLIRQLRALYPDSAMLHSAELVALYDAERFSDAVNESEEYLRLTHEGKYQPLEVGTGGVALGCALWRLGRLPEALDAFHQAERAVSGDKPSRWAVWARIRAGQLEDVMGRREDALADYKAAADEPDAWGLRAFAKAGLKAPFHESTPGTIEPPDA